MKSEMGEEIGSGLKKEKENLKMPAYSLPVGIDSFEKIRSGGYYYVDKTGFIRELMQKIFDVSLITRPRRFGKTLLMSMLAEFFDIRKDSKKLFEGLEASKDKALCSVWQNQWPVLFLTLKSVEGLKFDSAYGMLEAVVSELCVEHYYLAESQAVNPVHREIFLRLAKKEASEEEVKNSLYTLLAMMHVYYGKQVILLVDEYDVPLAKASENGYYEQMLDVIRSMLGQVLKGNLSLKFSVVTGCLRIAKESIFTGTNNFVPDTISGRRYEQYFGFTEKEVQDLLESTGFSEYQEEIRLWYDGYLFGREKIYCPWDVLNYINSLQDDPNARPENFWKNTSHNGIIRSFIDRTDLAVNEKFETLLAGGTILERIEEDLTYDVLHSSEENLWSILYLTGYLTQADASEKTAETGLTALKIPNREIRSIFTDTVAKWFQDTVAGMDRRSLFGAFWNGDAEKITEQLNDLLFQTISYYDYRESYYHAFLSGIFVGAGYGVESNREYGTGRPDIVVADKKGRKAIIIEVKHSQKNSEMEADCMTAMRQIQERSYADGLLSGGYRSVWCYGAAFCGKNCMVRGKCVQR